MDCFATPYQIVPAVVLDRVWCLDHLADIPGLVATGQLFDLLSSVFALVAVVDLVFDRGPTGECDFEFAAVPLSDINYYGFDVWNSWLNLPFGVWQSLGASCFD